MSAVGTWKVVVTTPVGDQKYTFEFSEDDGALVGSLTEPESASLYEVSAEGDELSWKVKITKPMPLKVKFKGTVDRDSMSGRAQAGIFPPAGFTGTRQTVA